MIIIIIIINLINNKHTHSIHCETGIISNTFQIGAPRLKKNILKSNL